MVSVSSILERGSVGGKCMDGMRGGGSIGREGGGDVIVEFLGMRSGGGERCVS